MLQSNTIILFCLASIDVDDTNGFHLLLLLLLLLLLYLHHCFTGVFLILNISCVCYTQHNI